MFKRRQTMVRMPLSDLHQGETGKITSIRGKVAEHRYLCFMGITVGCNLTIAKIDTTPRERIITVKTGETALIMDKYLARNIQLEVPIPAEERELLNV